MQKVSLVVSLVAMALMIGGFVDGLLGGTALSLPGASVLPVPLLLHGSRVSISLVAMSAGVLLIALLPAVRVLLALMLYASRRGAVNALVSMVVLVELLFSIRAGG